LTLQPTVGSVDMSGQRQVCTRRSPAVAFVVFASLCLTMTSAQAEIQAPKYRASPSPDSVAPGRGASGTVRARPRPDYDAIGIAVGSLRLYPQVDLGTDYDSNIYRTEAGQEAGLLMRARPAIVLASDWSQHALNVSVEAEWGAYPSHPQESYFDTGMRAAGRIDIRRGLNVETGLGFAHLHEARGSVDGDGGSEPTQFNRWTAQIGVAARTGRFHHWIGGTYQRDDFSDVSAIGGGTLNQDDRDQQSWTAQARVSYEAMPDTRVFVAGRYGLSDFDAATDDDGFNRDTRKQDIVAGIDLDLGGITILNLAAGWMGQQFDDADLANVAGVTANADLTVNVTPLTTVTAKLARTLNSTVTAGASAFTETSGRIQADHELLRNLLLFASLAGRRLAFRGIQRQDDHWAAGIGGEWLMNRSARISLRYDFDLRDSQGQDSVNNWRRHVMALRVSLQR
jgi:hypothetical protein